MDYYDRFHKQRWNRRKRWTYEDMDVHRPNSESIHFYNKKFYHWKSHSNFHSKGYHRGYRGARNTRYSGNYHTYWYSSREEYWNKNDNEDESYDIGEVCTASENKESQAEDMDMLNSSCEIHDFIVISDEELEGNEEFPFSEDVSINHYKVSEEGPIKRNSNSQDSSGSDNSVRKYATEMDVLAYLKSVEKISKVKPEKEPAQETDGIPKEPSLSRNDCTVGFIKRRRKSMNSLVTKKQTEQSPRSSPVSCPELDYDDRPITPKRQRRKSVHLNCCKNETVNKRKRPQETPKLKDGQSVAKKRRGRQPKKNDKEKIQDPPVDENVENERLKSPFNLYRIPKVQKVMTSDDIKALNNDLADLSNYGNDRAVKEVDYVETNEDFEVSTITKDIPIKSVNKGVKTRSKSRSNAVTPKDLLPLTEFRVTRSKSRSELFNLCPPLSMGSRSDSYTDIFKEHENSSDPAPVVPQKRSKTPTPKTPKKSHPKENAVTTSCEPSMITSSRTQSTVTTDAESTYPLLFLIDVPETPTIYRELDPNDPRRNYKAMIPYSVAYPDKCKDKETDSALSQDLGHYTLDKPQSNKTRQSEVSSTKSTPKKIHKRRKTTGDPDYKPYRRIEVRPWDECLSEVAKSLETSKPDSNKMTLTPLENIESMFPGTTDDSNSLTLNVSVPNGREVVYGKTSSRSESVTSEHTKPFTVKSPRYCKATSSLHTSEDNLRAIEVKRPIVNRPKTVKEIPFDDIVNYFFEHITLYSVMQKCLNKVDDCPFLNEEVKNHQKQFKESTEAYLTLFKSSFQEGFKSIPNHFINVAFLLRSLNDKSNKLDVTKFDMSTNLKSLTAGFDPANQLFNRILKYLEEKDVKACHSVEVRSTYMEETLLNDPVLPPTIAPELPAAIDPTLPPTTAPELSPAIDPSLPPTTAPELSPAIDPSLYPTTAPELSLAIDPSSPPTTPPELSPAIDPSLPPTTAPELSPAIDPSLPPTTAPELSPAIDPSLPPTTAPELSPAIDPLLPPTIAPGLPAAFDSLLPSTSMPKLSTDIGTSSRDYSTTPRKVNRRGFFISLKSAPVEKQNAASSTVKTNNVTQSSTHSASTHTNGPNIITNVLLENRDPTLSKAKTTTVKSRDFRAHANNNVLSAPNNINGIRVTGDVRNLNFNTSILKVRKPVVPQNSVASVAKVNDDIRSNKPGAPSNLNRPSAIADPLNGNYGPMAEMYNRYAYSQGNTGVLGVAQPKAKENNNMLPRDTSLAYQPAKELNVSNQESIRISKRKKITNRRSSMINLTSRQEVPPNGIVNQFNTPTHQHSANLNMGSQVVQQPYLNQNVPTQNGDSRQQNHRLPYQYNWFRQNSLDQNILSNQNVHSGQNLQSLQNLQKLQSLQNGVSLQNYQNSQISQPTRNLQPTQNCHFTQNLQYYQPQPAQSLQTQLPQFPTSNLNQIYQPNVSLLQNTTPQQPPKTNNAPLISVRNDLFLLNQAEKSTSKSRSAVDFEQTNTSVAASKFTQVPVNQKPRTTSTDSGWDSPLENLDENEAPKCFCGMLAFFECPCKQVNYCSASCQNSDWLTHYVKHIR